MLSKSRTAPASTNGQPSQGAERGDHRESRDRASTEGAPEAASAATAAPAATEAAAPEATATATAATAVSADASQPDSHGLPAEAPERTCSLRSNTVGMNAVSDKIAPSDDRGSSDIARVTTPAASNVSKDTAGAGDRDSESNLQEVQSFLVEKGLAKWSQDIVEAAGIESMQELRMMDCDDVEELIEAAGLPIMPAKKFRTGMVEITGKQYIGGRHRKTRQSAVSGESVESNHGPIEDLHPHAQQPPALQPSSANQEAPAVDKQLVPDSAAVNHISAQPGVSPPLAPPFEHPEANWKPCPPAESSLHAAGRLAESSLGQGEHQCSSPEVQLPPAGGGVGQGQAQTELQHSLATPSPSAKGADHSQSQEEEEKAADKIEWDYICVDPGGARTDGGTCYKYGDIVRICERKVQGALQLRAADGSGWLLEKQHGRRVMSEVTYELVPPHQEWLCTCPRLKSPVALQEKPYCSLAAAVASTGSSSLRAGDIVRVLHRARMLVPMPKNKAKEQWANFLRIAKPLASGTSSGDVEGWVPELLPNGDRLLLEYACENEFGYPQPWGWLSVLSSSATSQSGPGLHCSVERKLEAGDFIEAFGKLTVGGLIFYRLSETSWTCANPKGTKPLVDSVRREPHWFIYVCCDKDGGTVRHKPTRLNSFNTGSKVRHRQRVRTSELVTFSDGDSFILSEIPRGWVPTTKKGSSVQKMKIIQSLENFPVPAPVRRLSWSQQQLQPGFAPAPPNGHPMVPPNGHAPMMPGGGTHAVPPMHGIPAGGGGHMGWTPGPTSIPSPSPPVPGGGDFGLGSSGGGCGPPAPMHGAGEHFGFPMGPEPPWDGRSLAPNTGPETSDFGLPPCSLDPRSSFVALPSGKARGVAQPQKMAGDFGL